MTLKRDLIRSGCGTSKDMKAVAAANIIEDEDLVMAPPMVGHRQRLRSRFLSREESALTEEGLLELLLTFAIPQKDVRPLAGTLLECFGSLQAVLNADPDILRQVIGIGDTALILIELVSYIAAQQELRRYARINEVIISTTTSTDLSAIPSSSLDYIFTDPPYAEKVQYGELNFVWEAWLGFDTHWHDEEIIVNEVRDKTEADWATMMRQAMAECYRVLKPGRWLSFTRSRKSHDVNWPTGCWITSTKLQTAPTVSPLMKRKVRQRPRLEHQACIAGLNASLLISPTVRSCLTVNDRVPRHWLTGFDTANEPASTSRVA